ncbi:MAG: metallophosphoesterase [Clostridia bacterium]|nr:metallophosphoesterase [Clostridia bacterium]
MALYVLADTHLSFGTDKPMCIFPGWQDHVIRLEAAWRRLVKPEDTVVIPGDISWAMQIKDAERDLAFLHALPGQKIIGKGNHDYWWCTMRKMQEFLDANGFDSIRFLFNNACRVGDIAVCGTRGWFFDAQDAEDNSKIIRREAMRLARSIEEALSLGGTPVAFMHYPVVMDGQTVEPLMEVLEQFGITRCYFGHVHGDTSGRLLRFTERGILFSLISADALGFCPKKVLLTE